MKEDGFVITKPLDYMTTQGRRKLREEVEGYSKGQGRRARSMTEKMDEMIGKFYEQMVKENKLYPQTESSVDSETEKAIKVLRPKNGLKFKQYVEKHPEDSADPKKRKLRVSNVEEKTKIISYSDVNISRRKTLKDTQSEKYLKTKFLPSKIAPPTMIDRSIFLPKSSVYTNIKPTEKYGKSIPIQPFKISKNFLNPTITFRPSTANKSTQKTSRGLILVPTQKKKLKIRRMSQEVEFCIQNDYAKKFNSSSSTTLN